MDLVAIRKKLHQLAEDAGKEVKTAACIRDYLQKMGLSDITGEIGGTGVVATIDSGRPGPSVVFRAELDALPIQEKNQFGHTSDTEGVSHKCGHDGHMAILLGLAEKVTRKGLDKGTVHFLFQPAEETGEGAGWMLEDPFMKDLRPDHVFALHNLPGYDYGRIYLSNGVFSAGSKGMIVRLTGNTAHAAHPEKARSPASAVASLITDLERLPRSVIAFDRAALVTIIHAQIGEKAFGTTPGYAELMATLRAHDPDDLDLLGQKAEERVQYVAEMWKLEAEIEWTEVFEPTFNHPESVKVIEQAWKKIGTKADEYGLSGLTFMERPFSWSEDFGRFTKVYQGAMFGLGAGIDQVALHDNEYDFPDGLIEPGICFFNAILDVLMNEN